MNDHRVDATGKLVQRTMKEAGIDRSCLAVPLDLLGHLSLAADGELLKRSQGEGVSRLDVAVDGAQVATFVAPLPSGRIASLQRMQAANEPKAYSKVGKEDQWWDDDMLDEPLEPLREFI